MKDKQASPDRMPPDAATEFLARTSHEIRTPLNVVLGALELMLQTRISAEQLEYLELMKTAGESLLGLVNDILDYSRIEAGGVQLESAPFSLSRCLDDTLRMMSGEARKKGLSLRCELAPGMPDAVIGDVLRLRQVLVNLLANAIRFSERGEIVLRAGPEGAAGHELLCGFSVADQGIGIPPERQTDIFAPWRQADSATCRQHGGSGLGLAIAQRLVHLMGGEIGVDSIPGQGSTFHFTARFGRMPAAVPARRPSLRPGAAPGGPTPRLEILLVEDNPMNSRLARLALERAGHRVHAVETAATACEWLAAHRPDLVLLDLQLPDMDGTDAVAAIRLQERLLGRPRVPVVALTADLRPGISARCIGAGMDGYLAKPIDPAALWTVLGHSEAKPAENPLQGAIDRRTLLHQVQGDRRLLAEIRDLFLRDSGPLLARVHRALTHNDMPRLEAALHTLRGMFRSLAAVDAEKLAETLAACADDPHSADAAFARLAAEVERLGPALRQLLIETTTEARLRTRAPAHAPNAKAGGRRHGLRLPKPARHRLTVAHPAGKGATP